MQLEENRFARMLRQNRPMLGAWSMLNSSVGVEVLADAGFDWVLLDGEHSPMEFADALSHLRTLASSSLACVVRLPWNDPILLKRYLDIGANAIMLPYIETAGQAQAAVSAVLYPPVGRRGVAALHRASRYGRVEGYLAAANDQIFLIAQLETPQSIANLRDIAQVSGIGALFIGPVDLSANMGFLGRPDHPQVQDLVAEALATAKQFGHTMGALAPSDALAERYIDMGFDFVSVANDLAILARGLDSAARRFHEFARALPVAAGH